MAYASQSDRIVLFGGHGVGPRSGFAGTNQTWAYDFNSNTWTNMQPTTKPPGRFDHAMAYDSQSDRIIVFGGRNVFDGNETWAYDFDANTRTNMNPVTTPPPLSADSTPAMAYDSESDRIILVAGETWAYDFNTNTWTNLNAFITWIAYVAVAVAGVAIILGIIWWRQSRSRRPPPLP